MTRRKPAWKKIDAQMKAERRKREALKKELLNQFIGEPRFITERRKIDSINVKVEFHEPFLSCPISYREDVAKYKMVQMIMNDLKTRMTVDHFTTENGEIWFGQLQVVGYKQ